MSIFMATDLSPGSSRTPTSSITVVAAASFVGTAIEWYDFFLYGTSAVLVFPKLFFPASDPIVGTLLALATFAASCSKRGEPSPSSAWLENEASRRSPSAK